MAFILMEPKSQGKENYRSRIPRLVLRPFRPKPKESPLSESPFYGEESKDCDLSPDHSRRTISSNSFCSDDTGCPSSQSASPSKSPSGSESSPVGLPSPLEDKEDVKRTKTNVMAEWNVPPVRHKREPRSCPLQRGSEADFSSSSSAGSITTRETPTTGLKKPAFTRSRGPHMRSSVTSQKSAISPASSARDKDPFASLCRGPLLGTSSNSSSSNNSGSYKSSDTSPTISYRRSSGVRYTSCGDNHGVKPPNPEQYLTPLQQKEVTIRHLKTKLKDSETKLREREVESAELKAQLGRMREDWIEEECHRVEAQLALKEARKEIKQLRQVVETMKNSLVEKDKGIQKYFIDINIQNKKLEALLHSMELAQNGSRRDEPALDYLCGSPGKSLRKPYAKMEEGMALEDQAAEEMADSGLLVNDEMANQTDIFEQMLMSTAGEPGEDSRLQMGLDQSKLLQSTFKMPDLCANASVMTTRLPLNEKAVQTDVIFCTPDIQALLLHLLKPQDDGAYSSLAGFPEFGSSEGEAVLDLTPSDPNSMILVSPEKSDDSGLGSEPIPDRRFMKELDFDTSPEDRDESEPRRTAVVGQRYWSSSFIVDLLAVAAPVLPTVAWLYATHRGSSAPVYNIGALIRGCCVMGLYSLRHMPHPPGV
ncbi:syntabulin isoform X2 [Lepisosteus oculatus]|uniref:syntabulin isoform X2 n=1 Tax=Lepisosteus oculatus TaxID=7918 RepID=UPI0035F506F7